MTLRDEPEFRIGERVADLLCRDGEVIAVYGDAFKVRWSGAAIHKETWVGASAIRSLERE